MINVDPVIFHSAYMPFNYKGICWAKHTNKKHFLLSSWILLWILHHSPCSQTARSYHITQKLNNEKLTNDDVNLLSSFMYLITNSLIIYSIYKHILPALLESSGSKPGYSGFSPDSLAQSHSAVRTGHAVRLNEDSDNVLHVCVCTLREIGDLFRCLVHSPSVCPIMSLKLSISIKWWW